MSSQVTVVNNDTHRLLYFDTKAEAGRWAVEHGYTLHRSPIDNNVYHTSDPTPLPVNLGQGRPSDTKRAELEARRLYDLACKERDKQGYRENLGHDQRPAYTAFLARLDLTYQQESRALREFDRLMDSV